MVSGNRKAKKATHLRVVQTGEPYMQARRDASRADGTGLAPEMLDELERRQSRGLECVARYTDINCSCTEYAQTRGHALGDPHDPCCQFHGLLATTDEVTLARLNAVLKSEQEWDPDMNLRPIDTMLGAYYRGHRDGYRKPIFISPDEYQHLANRSDCPKCRVRRGERCINLVARKKNPDGVPVPIVTPHRERIVAEWKARNVAHRADSWLDSYPWRRVPFSVKLSQEQFNLVSLMVRCPECGAPAGSKCINIQRARLGVVRPMLDIAEGTISGVVGYIPISHEGRYDTVSEGRMKDRHRDITPAPKSDLW